MFIALFAIIAIVTIISALGVWIAGDIDTTPTPIYDEFDNTNFQSFDTSHGFMDTDTQIMSNSHSKIEINPATGLPMVGNDTCGIDVGGNVYGTNSNEFNTSSSFIHDDTSWTDHSSSWSDNSFGSSFDSSFDSSSSFNSWD